MTQQMKSIPSEGKKRARRAIENGWTVLCDHNREKKMAPMEEKMNK